MNQTQRKYLMDTLKMSVDSTVKALRNNMPEKPWVQNHLLLACMSGTLKLKPENEILEVFKKRALNSTIRNNWLNDDWTRGTANVSIAIDDLFVLPDEYVKQVDEYNRKAKEIDDTISELLARSQGLMTRIQLASNSTLERMIAEVDNMGDISLVDCTLKTLMAGTVGDKLLK